MGLLFRLRALRGWVFPSLEEQWCGHAVLLVEGRSETALNHSVECKASLMWQASHLFTLATATSMASLDSGAGGLLRLPGPIAGHMTKGKSVWAFLGLGMVGGGSPPLEKPEV